jgi:hypothetical protein
MQQNLAINAVYSAINTLPKKMQFTLVEKFIIDNGLINDLIDINIAKQRLNEPGTDYEEYRSKRRR